MRIDGERLRQARQRRLMTLRDLGDKCGISGPNLSRIENGLQEPRISTVKSIVEALMIPLDEILPSERTRDNGR
jgi:transcriptional regulator with XRE-family HTH domain